MREIEIDLVLAVDARPVESEMQTDIEDTNPFPEPVEIEITDVFDLHTIPPT